MTTDRDRFAKNVIATFGAFTLEGGDDGDVLSMNAYSSNGNLVRYVPTKETVPFVSDADNSNEDLAAFARAILKVLGAPLEKPMTPIPTEPGVYEVERNGKASLILTLREDGLWRHGLDSIITIIELADPGNTFHRMARVEP
jgi:hypothetical protein